MNNSIDIVKIQESVKLQLSNQEVMQTLVQTTFKGLDTKNIQLAIVEGMMRGFSFEDFLKKKVYALPFGSSYALVGGIDGARERGIKSGVVGKTEPLYEEKDGKVISCSVTIKKKTGEHIGDFTAKVYFDEYTTGKNLWLTKPRTMIAKIAEMHALRMSSPEELAQYYVEEEIERKDKAVDVPVVDLSKCEATLKKAQTLDELKSAWTSLPAEAKTNVNLIAVKNNLKEIFTSNKETRK